VWWEMWQRVVTVGRGMPEGDACSRAALERRARAKRLTSAPRYGMCGGAHAHATRGDASSRDCSHTRGTPAQRVIPRDEQRSRCRHVDARCSLRVRCDRGVTQTSMRVRVYNMR
jgi:hypothetical protein